MIDEINIILAPLQEEMKTINQFKAEIDNKQQELAEVKQQQNEAFDFENSIKIKDLENYITHAQSELKKRNRTFTEKARVGKNKILSKCNLYAKDSLANDKELKQLQKDVLKAWLKALELKSKYNSTLNEKVNTLSDYFNFELGTSEIDLYIKNLYGQYTPHIVDEFISTDDLIERIKGEL